MRILPHKIDLADLFLIDETVGVDIAVPGVDIQFACGDEGRCSDTMDRVRYQRGWDQYAQGLTGAGAGCIEDVDFAIL